jgi:hypothetical protein
MKIHESGDKYSTSSPSSSGQPIQRDRSSPEDFYQADDSSKSFCIPPPSRDHNPILASLLSQPANDGEVLQWVYHSPYDSYSSQLLSPQVSTTPVGDPSSSSTQPSTRADRRWSYDSLVQESCGVTRFESSKSQITVPKETTSLPLRHAIDVILGIKEEFPPNRPSNAFIYCGGGQDLSQVPVSSCVTTSSNHWSIGHLSSSGLRRYNDESPTFAESIDATQSSHELNSDVDSSVSDHREACAGYKRPRQMADLYHCSHSSLNQMSDVESLERDYTYVPKKLRMSKLLLSSVFIKPFFCGI